MQDVPALADLDDRSREVFRRVVEGYLESGDPVGSRTLTRSMTVSAATIRNVMSDLEHLGLISSPHISAGRLPTEAGLRLFVDGLLEVKDIDSADRDAIEATGMGEDGDVAEMLGRIGGALSALTKGASLVLAPRQEAPIRHIEFVALGEGRALVVMVLADGRVENRVFSPPAGTTPSAMREAANMLNAIAEGRTLAELRGRMEGEIERRRREIDALAAKLIANGLATWDAEGTEAERLIVRGRGNLLDDAKGAADLTRIRALFDDLERKRDITSFLSASEAAEGVRIFIGSENRLFSLSGSSLVVSPYMNADRKIVGAVGVIGPTRLNYGRIVPIVDYTAQLVGRMIGGGAPPPSSPGRSNT